MPLNLTDSVPRAVNSLRSSPVRWALQFSTDNIESSARQGGSLQAYQSIQRHRIIDDYLNTSAPHFAHIPLQAEYYHI